MPLHYVLYVEILFIKLERNVIMGTKLGARTVREIEVTLVLTD